MKIIHTSDWHIGQSFYRYDRADEHVNFFSQLCEIMSAERPDALVVSGDVFHTPAPAAAAQSLYQSGVLDLHDASPDTMIIISAGNHDSGPRLDAYRDLWERQNVRIIGSCRRNPDGTFDPEQFIVRMPGKGVVVGVPFIHSSNFPPVNTDTPRDERQRAFFDRVLAEAGTEMPVVMMAHLAVNGCDTRGHEGGIVGNIETEELSVLGEGYDYLALGHIHCNQKLSDRAHYSGSVVPVSFSEDYDHYVNVVDIPAHGCIPEVRRIRLSIIRDVVTLPPGGAPLADALAAFAKYDDGSNNYVRILVDQEGPLEADAEERAREIAAGKLCRFCEITRKPRAAVRASGTLEISSLDDFTSITPMEIATMSFKRITGDELTPALTEKLKQAIVLASENTQP